MLLYLYDAEYKPVGYADDLVTCRTSKYNPEKVRYKVIGVEMKGMASSMKLVALGATQHRG